MPAADKLFEQIRNNLPQEFLTQALFPVLAVFTLDLAIYEWAVRDGNSILDRWSQWSQDLRGSAVALALLALGALALGAAGLGQSPDSAGQIGRRQSRGCLEPAHGHRPRQAPSEADTGAESGIDPCFRL